MLMMNLAQVRDLAQTSHQKLHLIFLPLSYTLMLILKSRHSLLHPIHILHHTQSANPYNFSLHLHQQL